MNHTVIIAEAGVNHNGDLNLARRLVDAAAEAGADIVKFQTFRSERLVTVAAAKANYQAKNNGANESQLEMLKRLELSRQQHLELMAHCREKKIQFLSTPFDRESVEMLVELGVSQFKVPSGEINNVPHLRHLGAYGKPVILSTGTASLAEIEAALNVLEQAGTDRSQVTVLHCNTEYPTPMQDVNLRAMLTIRDAFQVKIGYSDHTVGIEISIAAVALGATIIEKHLTLDRTLPGPDQAASIEPHEFKSMVQAIRNTESAMGDGIKRPSPSERSNRIIVRKSIVAAERIMAGQLFTPDNLTVKRPGSGISPDHWDEIVGRIAQRDYLADELIEW